MVMDVCRCYRGGIVVSTLCKYDLRKGDLFVLSWARVRRMRRGSLSPIVESKKSECNNSGYKLTGLTWWPGRTGEVLIRDSWD